MSFDLSLMSLEDLNKNADTCSGYTLPFISATVFLEPAGGKVLAAIFRLITIFVPLAAILVIISASSTVMQAVGIFSTPEETSQKRDYQPHPNWGRTSAKKSCKNSQG